MQEKYKKEDMLNFGQVNIGLIRPYPMGINDVHNTSRIATSISTTV